MAQPNPVDVIRPVSDLGSGGSEIVLRTAGTQRRLVLTNQGREVAVVIGVDEYKRLRHAAEQGALVEALREGERDIATGDVLTHEEMRAKWLPGE
jgi:prevent-host-death family protein